MSQSTNPAPGQKKRRNPVERAIVWGLIAILVVAVAWEGWGRFGYSRTLSKWQNAIAAAEQAPDSQGLTLAQAEELITGSPEKSLDEGAFGQQTLTYRWNSLFGREYAILVSLTNGDPQEIVGLETAGAPPEEEPAPAVAADADRGEPAAEQEEPAAAPEAE